MSLLMVNATPSRIDFAVDTDAKTLDGHPLTMSKILHLAQPNLVLAYHGDRFLMRCLHDSLFLGTETLSFDYVLEELDPLIEMITQHECHFRDVCALE